MQKEMQYADLYWDRDPEEHEKFVAQLAPIVLFTYNRLEHTKKTVEALQQNVYAAHSELFIYSDAPKNEKAIESVKSVREYIHSLDGFKKITIIERDKNWGLARNIIDGVTEIVNKYGKTIVLEDDIVTSKYFLKYMNDALKIYKDESKVIMVNGYTFPVDINGLPETFFLKFAGCWGWATWKNKWKYFLREPEKIRDSFTEKDIWQFNFEGSEKGFFSQILANYTGELYTWAVFWYVAVYKYGLSLSPGQSLSMNCGMDGTGEHCGKTTRYNVELNKFPVEKFSLKIEEDYEIRKRFIGFFNKVNYVHPIRRVLHWCKLKLKKVIGVLVSN